MTVWLMLAIGLTIAVGLAIWRIRLARSVAASDSSVRNRTGKSTAASLNDEDNTIPFQTEATDDVTAAVFTFAFGIQRFDYQILGPHQSVLQSAKAAVAQVVNEQRYFPRKPSLLPKLLRALNTGDSSREEIVRLILQDPVLAGNVLRRANSVFYRQSNVSTESVDRAVVILGHEGLRAPVATAVMQPVFQLPRGFFEQFAPTTWELAHRTAMAAETYARLTQAGDAFVAHLLGLLGGLGRIVLFRLTLDKYRKHENIMPRAETFIRVMIDHEREVTRAIASAWEMSPTFLTALDAQIEQGSPERMTPLARTLYYATICGALAVLHQRDKFTQEDARALLVQQGLKPGQFDALWSGAFGKDPA